VRAQKDSENVAPRWAESSIGFAQSEPNRREAQSVGSADV